MLPAVVGSNKQPIIVKEETHRGLGLFCLYFYNLTLKNIIFYVQFSYPPLTVYSLNLPVLSLTKLPTWGLVGHASEICDFPPWQGPSPPLRHQQKPTCTPPMCFCCCKAHRDSQRTEEGPFFLLTSYYLFIIRGENNVLHDLIIFSHHLKVLTYCYCNTKCEHFIIIIFCSRTNKMFPLYQNQVTVPDNLLWPQIELAYISTCNLPHSGFTLLLWYTGDSGMLPVL